jgi:hypothetical protein
MLSRIAKAAATIGIGVGLLVVPDQQQNNFLGDLTNVA